MKRLNNAILGLFVSFMLKDEPCRENVPRCHSAECGVFSQWGFPPSSRVSSHLQKEEQWLCSITLRERGGGYVWVTGRTSRMFSPPHTLFPGLDPDPADRI